jgi:hypothetical protein
MFATTGGMPTAVSMGKMMSVPPPASAFTSPPATAANPIMMCSNTPMVPLKTTL